jgi:hypothetical protein
MTYEEAQIKLQSYLKYKGKLFTSVNDTSVHRIWDIKIIPALPDKDGNYDIGFYTKPKTEGGVSLLYREDLFINLLREVNP